MVRIRREELVEQVAIRSMNLHAVGSRRDRRSRRMAKLSDDAPDSIPIQCTRGRDLLRAINGVHLLPGRDLRRSDRSTVVRGVVRVRDSPHVHQLNEQEPPSGVHRIGNLPPSGDMVIRVDAGGVQVPLAVGRRLRAFGDDQPERCALTVVRGHQWARGAVSFGAVSGHGGHRQAMWKYHAPEGR